MHRVECWLHLVPRAGSNVSWLSCIHEPRAVWIVRGGGSRGMFLTMMIVAIEQAPVRKAAFG
jgi:hypothetical protein